MYRLNRKGKTALHEWLREKGVDRYFWGVWEDDAEAVANNRISPEEEWVVVESRKTGAFHMPPGFFKFVPIRDGF